MNQIKNLQIKCSNREHDSFMELACFDKSCKANRIYCHECLRKSQDHVGHQGFQWDLIRLIQFIEEIRQKSDELIKQLTSNIEKINQSFSILSQGLQSKYQLSKEQIQKLNGKQLNQAFDQMLKYEEIAKKIQSDVEKSSNDTFIEFNRIITELNLHQHPNQIYQYFKQLQMSQFIMNLKNKNYNKLKIYILKVKN